jgi:hypothetical protein
MTEMVLTLDSPLARSEILGYMVFPRDEKYRNWWRLSTIAEAIARENVNASLSAQEIKTLNDGPGFGAMKDLVRKATLQDGVIAGETLMLLLRLEQSGIKASLGKAQYMIGRALSRMPRNDGKPLPGSTNSIRNAWLNFRSVAHLWAARQFTVAHSIVECDLKKNHLNFLGLAASFHRLASTLTSHDGKPMFGTDTWDVPSNISTFAVRIDPLANDEKTDLKTYRPRARD